MTKWILPIACAISFTVFSVLVLLYISRSFLQRETPVSSFQPSPTSAFLSGDIDRDGVAGDQDARYVKLNLGCGKEADCWKKSIGKTRDGDNPFYVFDLDLNGDGVISQSDVDLIGTK